jgi:2-oxoglutarate ferredoxin oxidoreductase subunit gamma
MKKIRIAGMGGQGIRYSAHIFGEAVTQLGLYAAVHHSYGAEVRGGRIYSDITYDETPITSPYSEKLDIALILHKLGISSIRDHIETLELIIVDEELLGELYPHKNIVSVPLHKTAYSRDLPLNMVALGYLANKCGIRLEALLSAIRDYKRNREINIRAVKEGYKL